MRKHTLTQQCCHKHRVIYYNPHSSLSSSPAVHGPTRRSHSYATSQLLAAYQLPPSCVAYLKSRPTAAPSFLVIFSPPSPTFFSYMASSFIPIPIKLLHIQLLEFVEVGTSA